MTTTEAFADWQQAAATLVKDLRAKGSLTSDQVAAAIMRHPRHLYIPDAGLTAGSAADPAALMARAYSDIGIMTHTPDDPAGTFSSNSQPSIVVKLLEAIGLRHGMKAGQIGAGTGWMDALASFITERTVHSVEHSAKVAEEARQHLAADGCDKVVVHHGDGYFGLPGEGEFDVLFATVGVAGVPPVWVGQLTRDENGPTGSIVVPLAHAGMHPLARITVPSGSRIPVAQLLTMADFMNAEGPLYGGRRTSPAVRQVKFPEPEMKFDDFEMPAGLDDRKNMSDLWMYLAARDNRTTCAAAGTIGGCALVTEDERSAVFVRPDGLYPTDTSASTMALAEAAAMRVTDWQNSGRPPLTAWRSELVWSRDERRPLWMPTTWTLAGN